MNGRLAQNLEAFFTERLLEQKRASEHTIASYRDTFRLLLAFVQERLGRAPSTLEINDLDARLVGEFLTHLEKVRGNSIRSRNVRLAAIHSYFRFLALREPAHSSLIQGVLAIPTKRTDRRPIEHLSQEEVEALLAAPDTNTWLGRRDRTLLHLATETGLRVSELTGLRRQDVHLGRGPHVRCLGKGRKERCTPLRRPIVDELKRWLTEIPDSPEAPLLPSIRGGPLSRDAVSHLLREHLHAASVRCPSLKGKRLTPHGLRHTRAMSLLEGGVDPVTIALWLGHESVETTRVYLNASLRLKERALERTSPPRRSQGAFRYKPDDRLLAFLEGL